MLPFLVGGAMVLAPFVSAAIQSYFANEAAKTQADAAEEGKSTLTDYTEQGIDAIKEGTTGGVDALNLGADQGIDALNKQFEDIKEILSPYIGTGESALSAQGDLLGLNGSQAQASAIRSLESSPEMQALVGQGETAILQNASATGGLRGGNTQGALAQFRPQMLADLINRRYGQLGGLSALGQNTAMGQAGFGMQTGQGIANIQYNRGAGIADLLRAKGEGIAGMNWNLGQGLVNLGLKKAGALAGGLSATGQAYGQAVTQAVGGFFGGYEGAGGAY